MTNQMKKKIIFSIPFILFVIYFITSCCKKDENCINKYDGKYECLVDYKYGSINVFSDSLIIQNISEYDDTTLLFDITIGDDSKRYDTVNIVYSSNISDSIHFNNLRYRDNSVPYRHIDGYIVNKKIDFLLDINIAPSVFIVSRYKGTKNCK